MNDDKTAIDAIEDMLSKHDWFYSYSDDFRVYSRGERSYKQILAAVRKLPAEVVRANVRPLWMHYAPGEYKAQFDLIFLEDVG